MKKREPVQNDSKEPLDPVECQLLRWELIREGILVSQDKTEMTEAADKPVCRGRRFVYTRQRYA